MLSQLNTVMEVMSILIYDRYICSWNKNIISPTDGSIIHSLCPALGKRHALAYKGMCPLHLRNPLGKEINAMFDLHPPYAMPSPFGGMGSDFILMQLLASKFGFIPRFIYETNITAQLYNVS